MIILFGLPGLLLLFVIAIIAAVKTRECPHCAERIKKAAAVCRYCGRDVAPGLDPYAPRSSRWRRAILALLLLGTAWAIVYSQGSAPQPGVPAASGASRMEVAAPAPMPAAAPFVNAPTGTVSSAKATPKDAKPKAPAGPLRITPQ